MRVQYDVTESADRTGNGPTRAAISAAGARKALISSLNLLRITLRRTFADNLWIMSAGVAFYAFLSIFPAIAGTLMVWGLFSDPLEIRDQISVLGGIAPPDAFALLSDALVRIAENTHSGFTFGAILSLLFALWSASRAAQALMQTLNIAYEVERPRGFVSGNLNAIRFTILGICFALFSLAVIGAVPPLLESLRLGVFVDILIRGTRWILLVGVFFAIAAMAYRRTPTRRGKTRRSWRRHPVVPGAAIAAGLWLVASFGFSFYLTEFDAYSRIFGSLGAVAALLMWFWISAYAVGIGAEFNATLWLAQQRAHDRSES